jgi:sterol desaturase/sphingolipid hydroxylase (fatty acid hydroxylase superfamily)
MLSLVRYFYAPFMMLGLIGAAYWVVANGYSYFWLAPLLAVAYAASFAAEKIAPFFEEWNDHHAHGDTQTNVLHLIAYELSIINGVLLIPLIVWLFPFQGIWPTEWPLWGQALLAFIAADIGFMMMHYLSHRIPLLWRLHSVHHGVGRLYGFNGVIRHPLHQSIDMVVANMPLVIMGMPVDVAVLLGFMISVTLIVQHSNVDARLGFLDGHLSIGRVHHLHHVNWGTDGDCNFGLFLTVWDRMLGTFHAKPPRPITAADMGVDELPNFPKSFWEQMILPFVYKPGQGEPERYRKLQSKPTPAQEARRVVANNAGDGDHQPGGHHTGGLHPAE